MFLILIVFFLLMVFFSVFSEIIFNFEPKVGAVTASIGIIGVVLTLFCGGLLSSEVYYKTLPRKDIEIVTSSCDTRLIYAPEQISEFHSELSAVNAIAVADSFRLYRHINSYGGNLYTSITPVRK